MEFDKKFFHRQLDRITKSYQQEMRTMKARARDKAIEFVERNMYIAKEAMTKEINQVTRQFDNQVKENEILKKHASSRKIGSSRRSEALAAAQAPAPLPSRCRCPQPTSKAL